MSASRAGVRPSKIGAPKEVIENAQADVCLGNRSGACRSDGRQRGPTMVPSAGRQHVLLSLLIAAHAESKRLRMNGNPAEPRGEL